MKARHLRTLLGTTRPTADFGDYIGVGSALCHDLIRYDKKTRQLRYALGWPRCDRASLSSEELEAIWDKLEALVASGEIDAIIAENDDIPVESRVPVFYVENYQVVETYTDEPGWPNVTFDGRFMYANEFYSTREEALRRGIQEAESMVQNRWERVERLESELSQARSELGKAQDGLELLRGPAVQR